MAGQKYTLWWFNAEYLNNDGTVGLCSVKAKNLVEAEELLDKYFPDRKFINIEKGGPAHHTENGTFYW